MTPISQTPTGSAREAVTGTLPAPRAAAGAAGASGAHERSRIELAGVTKRFVSPTGTAMTALRDVSFTVEPGQFCAVVGPTGCGKSTTLTMVAGLEPPSAGVVRVGGRAVDGIADHMSFMFQNDALLPWKSVLQNVALGPRFRGVPKAEALEKAREWIRVVGLTGFEDHHPHQLSGGMRKRATLAASLISEPSILLMDEPFGALDVQTKAIMSNELLTLWERTKPSVIFITHDLEEAVALADRVVVMTAGPGTVKAVYDIDLPRPRGAVQEIRFEPRFLELHQQIWESLREEVERAYARTGRTTESTGGRK
ncbi:ABC transporter ATP-binding protein [Cellulomonas sp. P24]|uniref:ABC transporter ATP-binding protein n=1 Tax=Cellulomonas sp. P24 TaxID=2885206 RepID=UPI00216B093F|nr:ABC transporter ATP-binding protein [Cellulomonas sp. P24]MCR6491570.1 ABC transporter ATP-binding protein [Cellulomonas sp. P24]